MGILFDLLQAIGVIVRVDQNTLLRLKGKFARICVNVDITRPLSGSITIAKDGFSSRVPLIYEGLHEVCPLCGGESHQLESCPKLPVSKKIEVLVERFDAQGVSFANISRSQSSSTSSPSSKPIDTWVTVTPKKRMRAINRPTVPTNGSKPATPPIVIPSSAKGFIATPCQTNLTCAPLILVLLYLKVSFWLTSLLLPFLPRI